MPYNLQPGDLAPPFRTQAVKNGEILSDFTLEDAMRNAQYLLLAFYPSDFTFSCPSEVLQFAEKADEFASQMQCNIVCCSTDSAYSHLAWLKAPTSERGLGWTQQQAVSDGSEAVFPVLLSDQTRETSEAYGVLTPDGKGSYRANFLIGPDRRICQATVSDMPVGRCIEEVQRQLTEMRSIESGSGGAIRRSARATPGCTRPKIPEQMQIPMRLQQQQQQHQLHLPQPLRQQFCPQHQYQPSSASIGVMTGVTGYQREPLNIDQPACSTLVVEAANLEKQAAMLRVKDSEDRLAWMQAEVEKLRMESDRLKVDTERLKSEARRREVEAERLLSCHSNIQYGKSGGGGVDVGGVSARLPVAPTAGMIAEDCSWQMALSAGANCQGGRQPQQQAYNQCQPKQMVLQQQQQQLSRSHVCRRSNKVVASHFGRKC